MKDKLQNVNVDVEYDLYRDSYVRYLGYANEVGESFRALVPGSWVRASYTLAFAYVFADVADKTIKINKKTSELSKVAKTGMDALLWQTLASVVIPGYVINRLCYASLYLLKRYSTLPSRTSKIITAGVGLASVPVIIHPIDNSVTWLMDNTYRKIV